VFELAGLALALLEESGQPYAPGMSRGDLLDRLYETSDRDGSGRADKVAFVVAAGGEL
jgi:hypothetical protein